MIKLLAIGVQLAVALALHPIAKRRRAGREAGQEAEREVASLASAIWTPPPPHPPTPALPDDLHGAMIAIIGTRIRRMRGGDTPIYSADLNPRDVSVLRAVCDIHGIDADVILDADDPYAAARAELDKSPLRRAVERVT